MLTKDTAPEFKQPDSLSRGIIPQNIFDATQVVAAIDEEYLWVDSLCILQDDEEDEMKCFPIMDSIHSQSTMTIIAAFGGDVHAGFKRYL